MGLLDGKRALIFGVANDHSIAWGIAQALHREGAQLAFSYAGEKLERRVRPLAESLGSTFVEPCDVSKDEDIIEVMAKTKAHFGELDILIHSIAYAGRDDLAAEYYRVSREGFRMALDISVYSFTALAREAFPIMTPGGSMLTMTYIGSERVVPHYNVMGVAKAALEASVRYLAADFGPTEKRVRVNGISAGPIRTLAVAGISGSRTLISEFAKVSFLRRNITIEDVGNSAAYLCSDLAAGVTGEIHYVDTGFRASLGAPEEPPG